MDVRRTVLVALTEDSNDTALPDEIDAEELELSDAELMDA